jgi:hypothetical protein
MYVLVQNLVIISLSVQPQVLIMHLDLIPTSDESDVRKGVSHHNSITTMGPVN